MRLTCCHRAQSENITAQLTHSDRLLQIELHYRQFVHRTSLTEHATAMPTRTHPDIAEHRKSTGSYVPVMASVRDGKLRSALQTRFTLAPRRLAGDDI